jgi:hypothetical protein
MPFDGPANDTIAVLAKTEEYLQRGARWMQGYWPNPEGKKCLLAAVKWAMLEDSAAASLRGEISGRGYSWARCRASLCDRHGVQRRAGTHIRRDRSHSA